METLKHVGGCHCGKVTYEADVPLEGCIACNCSHCEIKGLILGMVPASQFKLLSGEDNLTTYHFNKHVIDHPFCIDCGVQSFGRGKGPDGSEMVAVNLRCLKDIDVSTLKPMSYDGRKL